MLNIENHSPAPVYHNADTFIDFTPIAELPPERLIVLDGYAFDINDLVTHGSGSQLQKIYTNPYLEHGAQQNEFSEEAKSILRAHPLLGQYAREFDELLRVQSGLIRVATVDEVLRMAQSFARTGTDGSEDALAAFRIFQSTLSTQEKSNLDGYIVSLPFEGGGSQNMRFEDILKHSCIQAQQMFLWQFIVQLRPEASLLIPETVQQIAQIHHVVIRREAQLHISQELMLSMLFLTAFPIVVGLLLGDDSRARKTARAAEQLAHVFLTNGRGQLGAPSEPTTHPGDLIEPD